MAIFQLRLIITTASAPNKDGSIFAKAGAKTGASSSGRIQKRSNTPIAMTTVVTIELTAIAIVETSSPSSVPASAFTIDMAFIAQGTLRFVKFPVTKPLYEPPTPSIGTKVNTSIVPTVQKVGAIPIIPIMNSFQCGHASKYMDIAVGTAIRSKNALIIQIRPAKWILLM